MSNSTKKTFSLSVTIDDIGVELSVMDGQGATFERTYNNSFSIDLPRGLYTVRAERNGQYEDTMVRLTKPVQVTPKLPPKYSAIPLPDAETTHEYYSYTSWEVSQVHTAGELAFNGQADSSLMLFMRAPELGRTSTAQKAATLSLRSLDGGVLSQFSEPNVRIDQHFGYAAFSAAMSSGSVILQDNGESPRQTRLPLLRGFQTQVYVMYLGRPLYEDIRILSVSDADISTRGHRDPYTKDEFSDTSSQIDAGMAALQNNVEDVGASLVNSYVMSKFSNPVLGLLGAYLLLLRRRQRPNKQYNDNLPKIIIDNLNNLIPGSPDLIALKYLAEPWLGAPEHEAVTLPPLFRAGAEILIKAAARDEGIIPEGSLFDAVSEHILGDSAWTTWSPVPLPVESATFSTMAPPVNDALNWIEIAVADNLVNTKKELHMSDLAERIGATKRSVAKAFSRLTAKSNNAPELISQEGIDPSFFQNLSNLKGRLSSFDHYASQFKTQLKKRKSKEDKPTFQNVYPTLKNVLADFSENTDKISAKDKLEDLIQPEKMDAMRKRLFKKLKRKFPKAAMNVSKKDFKSSKTVRDLANIVVKKHKL